MKCKKDCLYYCKSTDTCDFYLMTGTRRGCSYNDCTRYVKLPRPNTALQDFCLKKSAQWNIKFNRMGVLYNEGKYDKEIADAVGCSVQTVKKWRKREGLVSQTERQKKLKEERKYIESKT